MRSLCVRLLGAASLIVSSVAFAADRTERLEFTTMVAHWAEYGDPSYIDFIAEARPELVQLGFYGAHFWSLAATPQFGGYPAHFPVRGHAECREWFREKTRAVQATGAKVVGHMNVKFLVGDPDSPDGPRGFFKFYRDQWDAERLGPKPVEDPLTLLERDVHGELITNGKYGIGGMKEYWGCLNNPQWRQVLKAWTKYGIDQGVDGFIANYFYRHDCHCEHCVKGFKTYLSERFTADELKQLFQIENLAQHRFAEIVAWHSPKESTPLRRESLRWSQLANKAAFDDVFVNYGRSLKPDLIAAQWNHLSDFSQISGDERCMLPGDVWGRSEDYLWYSTGDAAHFTDLASGMLGEGTLQARYIRGAFDDKPFTLGKYESTRTRVAIAELAANGGAPMGFYTRFRDPLARQEIARYYGFIRQHADLFKANRPAGEVVLLFPRSEVQQGRVEAVARFKEVGKALLNEHVLFDIVPDDLKQKLEHDTRHKIDPIDPNWREKLSMDSLSQFKGPTTVRVSASRSANNNAAMALHFVNYNRTEPAKKGSAGSGIVDEKPIAVAAHQVVCQLRLPPDQSIESADFLTPERSEPQSLKTQQSGRVAEIHVPEFLVYGVVKIQTKPSAQSERAATK